MANNDFRYEGMLPVTYEQKCPLVLVLDVSGSMYGNPIDELNKGIKALQEDIQKDVTASARLEVAIVTFGSNINVVQDFSTLERFEMPTLTVSGTTKMVDGMRKALDILNQRKKWYKETGQTYYRPYIILITDGYPDDDQDIDWLSYEIDRQASGKHLNFWAFGVEGSDMQLLKEIGTTNSLIGKLKGVEFVKFFQWLSSSMSAVSKSKEGDIIDIVPIGEQKDAFDSLQIKV